MRNFIGLQGFIGFVIALAAIGLIVWISIAFSVTYKEVKVPIQTRFEQAVEMQEFENRFIRFYLGPFAGAGGAAQGASVLYAGTPEEFLQGLNSADEKIYSVVRRNDELREGWSAVEKLYITSTESGGTLLAYRDSYWAPGPKRDGWTIKSFGRDGVVFSYKTPTKDVDAARLFISIFVVIGFVLGFGDMQNNIDSAKKRRDSASRFN